MHQRRERKLKHRNLNNLAQQKAERIRKKSENMVAYLANMELGRRRKEARKIKSDFTAQWEKDYGWLFRKTRKAEKKRYREIRDAREKSKRDPNSWKIKRRIRNRPALCYWCGIFLPDGAEVDHVVPVAKGGDDGSCNLVPSCQTCNRVKQGGMPNGENLRVSKQFELLLVSDFKNPVAGIIC